MKKNIRSIYLLEILILVFAVFYPAIAKNTQLNKYMLKVAFSVFALIVFALKFGIKKDNSLFKKYAVLIVIVNILITLIILYALGIFIGYGKSLFSLNPKTIFNGLGLTIIDVLATELVRFIICKNSFENKKPIIVYTILLITIEILLRLIDNYSMNNYELFEFICSIVIALIAKESLCSYIAYNIGFTPAFIYNLLPSIYIYIFPFVPMVNTFLSSILHIVFPFSIYASLHKMLAQYGTRSVITNKKVNKILFLPAFAMLMVVVILVAGIFDHKMIAIASNSMNPSFYRGDAIIYEKTSAANINVGEVLVFVRDGKIICHRVVKKYMTNDDVFFKTKGDNNNTDDDGFVYSKDILGKAENVIKWIGYPTVVFSEFIEKE